MERDIQERILNHFEKELESDLEEIEESLNIIQDFKHRKITYKEAKDKLKELSFLESEFKYFEEQEGLN